MKTLVPFSAHRCLPCYTLRRWKDTTLFQGHRKRNTYFEGWYFKMVSADGTAIFSVIPGLSLSREGKEQHAFIQLINGVTAETHYFTFPIEAFAFSTKAFALTIGPNCFSKERLVLDLKDDQTVVTAQVDMFNGVDYTVGRGLNVGIMGWYRFVPFMECYHGVVSLTHHLKGSLVVNGAVSEFEGGKGYIEKDWGSSMPSAWIWMQSNNFNQPDSSFMLSIATIPWRSSAFTGFLGFFYHEGVLHHFATYRSTKLSLTCDDSNGVTVKLENKSLTFVVAVQSAHAGLLKAPTEGAMDRRIPESIDAVMDISVYDKAGRLVLTDRSTITGLEMVGDYKNLHKQL